jgi:hypothetical protein
MLMCIIGIYFEFVVKVSCEGRMAISVLGLREAGPVRLDIILFYGERYPVEKSGSDGACKRGKPEQPYLS